jgi:glycosyltransferase involved in cell wall biosynthesis
VSRPRAVAVCSRSPFPTTSGGRKRTLRLLEAMERAGATPHLLTLEAAEGRHEPSLERGWAHEVFPPPATTVRSRLRQHLRQEEMPLSAPLRARLRELAPTSAFVQLEEIDAAQYVHVAAPLARSVVSLHNVDSEVARDQLGPELSREALGARYRAARMARAERRAVRRAETVVCVSEHDRAHFAGEGALSALLIPNGVDDDYFAIAPGPSPEERVLFFGAFAWRPNADGLRRFVADAWPLVRCARPAARLRIAGPRARDVVGDLHSAERGVEVVGFIEDLTAELTATRVVVAPLWVGGGTRIKVLEAMAAARPVVGTTVGVEQIGFEHGRHGFVADEPAGLAEATSRLLDDGELAAACGARARAHVEDQRWTDVTRPAEELYRRLIAGREGG